MIGIFHLFKNIFPEPNNRISRLYVYSKQTDTCVQDMIFKRQYVSNVSNEHGK